MNRMETGLIIVLGYFLGICLFIYLCFKIYHLIKTRKSRHYQNMLAAEQQQNNTQMQGDYVLVNIPPIQPHLFGRSYKYKEQDFMQNSEPENSKKGKPPESNEEENFKHRTTEV